MGPFTEIQKNVKIGNNTKIQSHSFICELVCIGNNCFIGHGVVFINDKFEDLKPANGNKKKWLKTKINSNVYIGSNSTILPVSICSNVVIGADQLLRKTSLNQASMRAIQQKKLNEFSFILFFRPLCTNHIFL